jgi:hypothetical protein
MRLLLLDSASLHSRPLRPIASALVLVCASWVAGCSSSAALDETETRPSKALSTQEYLQLCPEGGGGPQPLYGVAEDEDPDSVAEQWIGGDGRTVRLVGQGPSADGPSPGAQFQFAIEVWQYAAYDDESGKVVAIDAIERREDGTLVKGHPITCHYES